jgi:hypothetical protein
MFEENLENISRFSSKNRKEIPPFNRYNSRDPKL